MISSAFCLLGILICSSFLGAEALSCARGWSQNQGSCYAYFDHPLTWSEAETDCQYAAPGGHLASVLSKAETDLLARRITNYQKSLRHVWIGLRDVNHNKKWNWSDGSIYNYKAWNTYQPDNYGNSEYCVELTSYSDFKRWNDVPCRRHNAYICKYQLWGEH